MIYQRNDYMRWYVTRKHKNQDNELLQTAILYAEHEKGETVRRDNEYIKHDRELIKCEMNS